MNRQSITQRITAALAKPTWVSSLTTRCGRSIPKTIQPAHDKLSVCLSKRARNESTLREGASSDLTAEHSLQPPGAGTALEQLLHGRNAALLWVGATGGTFTNRQVLCVVSNTDYQFLMNIRLLYQMLPTSCMPYTRICVACPRIMRFSSH